MTKTILEATICNHWSALRIDGRDNTTSGICAADFPAPEVGYRYRVTIEKIGPDQSEEPNLFAFLQTSVFGGAFVDIDQTRKSIVAGEATLKSVKNNPAGRAWWQSRLSQLRRDQANYETAAKAHKRALTKWRRDVKKKKL